MEGKITREKAWELLCKYNESDALRKHGIAVQVISNGNTMLCSFDFYEKLIKSKKLLKEMTK